MNLVQTLYRLHEMNIRIQPQPNNRASSIGAKCLRQLVYARVAWQLRAKPSIETQMNFDEGHLHEKQLIIELLQANINVCEQQASGMDTDSKISFHLDAIVIDDKEQRYPLEIKSCSPHIFDAISKYDEGAFKKAMDELGKSFNWLTKYPAQVLTYCKSRNLPTGIILFKNKANGRLKQFFLHLAEHTEYMEEIKQKSLKIDSIVKEIEELGGYEKEEAAAKLPARCNDSNECKYCDYRFSCLPDVDFGSPLSILTDEMAEAKIDRWWLLSAIAKEYSKIDDEVKLFCRNKANLLLGKYHITGKQNKAGNWLKEVTIVDDAKLKEIVTESMLLLEAIGKK